MAIVLGGCEIAVCAILRDGRQKRNLLSLHVEAAVLTQLSEQSWDDLGMSERDAMVKAEEGSSRCDVPTGLLVSSDRAPSNRHCHQSTTRKARALISFRGVWLSSAARLQHHRFDFIIFRAIEPCSGRGRASRVPAIRTRYRSHHQKFMHS